MKKLISIFTFFLFGIMVSYAQILDNNHGKKSTIVIPLEDVPEIEKPEKTLELPTVNKKDDNPFMKTPEKKVDYWGKSKYVRRKVDFNPNYGTINDHKREEYQAEKGDQFFGDFPTNGEYVNLYCRDHEAIDGDRVSILVNDEVQVHDIFLVSQFRGFQVKLKPGFNKIEFLALNQGESGPNTAEFQIRDDKGNLIKAERWNLATGYKAQFVIIKEQKQKENEEKEK